jgi:hypothetical protein
VTSSSVRRLCALLVAACAGCGVSAPDITTAGRCNLGTLPLLTVPLLIEEGVAARTCQTYASILVDYRDTFVEWWGPVALLEEGWTVRVRAGAAVDAAGHTGITYHHSRVVDIGEGALETFPHELRHVQLGRGSDDHHGWCSSFAPWEEEVLGVNERDYLGCQL